MDTTNLTVVEAFTIMMETNGTVIRLSIPGQECELYRLHWLSWLIFQTKKPGELWHDVDRRSKFLSADGHSDRVLSVFEQELPHSVQRLIGTAPERFRKEKTDFAREVLEATGYSKYASEREKQKYLAAAAEKFIDSVYSEEPEALMCLLSTPSATSGISYPTGRDMCVDQLLKNMGYLTYIEDKKDND